MVERQPLLFPDNVGVSGVLTDGEIRSSVDRSWLIVDGTFQESSLEASSYDIRIGTKAALGGEGREIDLTTQVLELPPGAYCGLISYEKLFLPETICARIGSKRALSYDGVILLTGSTVDPGYEGHLLFGLYNASQRKVFLRLNKKICNIVFERLSKPPEKQAPSDPNLRRGNFPDAFLERIANLEVLPWSQISERVKQIETITKDIIDLKARYDDVLKPIRELTENVKNVSQDLGRLTSQTSDIAKDLDKVNKFVEENSRQINQLTANVGVVQDKAKGLEEVGRVQGEAITAIREDSGKFKLLVYIFWAVLLLALGSLLPAIIERVWPKNQPSSYSPGTPPGPPQAPQGPPTAAPVKP